MGKDGRNQARPRTATGYTFVNINLAKVDQEWLAAADIEHEFPFELLFGLVSQGYKISHSEDAANHTFVCSFTDTRSDSPTHKCILTGRGATPLNAWGAACYRHFRIAQENWDPFVNTSGNMGSGFG